MKKKNKRRIPAIVATLVVLLALGGVAAYFVPVLKVGEVTVEGAKKADHNAIVAATGITPGDNMLRVDTDSAAQAVSSVPWVEKVTVSRSWPTSVTVTVTEHNAVGFIAKGNDVYAVNDHGSIFLRGVRPETAVEFRKTDPSDGKAVQAAATAVSALSPDVRGQLDYIEAKNAESLELVLKDGRRVHWGSAERASEKAEATRVVLQREGKKWNVSNPAMPTVRA